MLRPRVRTRSLLLSALFGAWLTVTGCSNTKAETQPKMPPPDVAVAQVLTKQAEDWNDFNGRLEAVNSVELHPRVSGVIDSVKFTEGTRVKKGDLLFQIDPRPFALQVTRLEAERRKAQTQLDLAKADGDRNTKLFQSGAIAKAEYDRTATADTAAAASLDSIKGSIALARLDLEFSQVRAPIDGRVSRALITAGNLVSPSSALTTIVSDGALYVYFDVDEQTFLTMQKGGEQAKTVKVGLVDEKDYPHTGAVDFTDNRLDQRTGTVRARATLPNADGHLMPGLFARVRLVGGRTTPAMLVDDKAIMTDQDRKYVYVIDGQGLAQRKNIAVGRIVEGLRVVESGLEANDKVVVHGVQKIFFPGMPVKPTEIKMGDPPPAPPQGAGPGH